MGRAIPVGLVVAVFAVSACSSCSSSSSKGAVLDDGGGAGDAASGPADAGPTAAQACADFATAVCNRLQACLPAFVQTAYGDSATCEQRTALPCASSVAASGSQAVPGPLEGCAQAISAQTCDESLGNAQPSACNLAGTLSAGTACGVNWQCQSGYCKLTAGSACGTCATHVAAGGACVADVDCTAGLLCNQSACISAAEANTACGATQPCARTLSCINGMCKAPLGVGAACSAATDCDGAHGLYCSPQMKCAESQVAASGQPCGSVNGTLVGCSGGDTCVSPTGTGTQGTCHPPAADGALCGPGVACLAPAICTGGTCTVPNATSCH